MNHLCFNGKIITSGEPLLMPDNRGYRYGDGLFETMKLIGGRIILEQLHFDRLWHGLQLLQFEIPKLFKREKLHEEIIQLCKKNNYPLARIRLSVFRGNGGLYDGNNTLQYLIECWPLTDSVNQLNSNGLTIDVFADARKTTDVFSNLKSANYLPYSMAAQHARTHQLNDCLVLNHLGAIADSTIANVFIVQDGRVRTPALDQGCVNGVMRKHLLEQLSTAGHQVEQGIVTINDLENADEIFLTNAINGIRWVKQSRNKIYTHRETLKIYQQFVQTIFS